ncbi:hypothetical protein ACIQU6_20820 [Streptomyces sp. NPDC090442]|uniref:hypothetical protein n=1 Tax=Streptomyces sp. NPDC090442 TaxID=3365962 RepID=UPI00382D9D54
MPQVPNAHLTQLLNEADWKPSQLAVAIRSVAREHGDHLVCSPSTVGRWLTGTQPRPPAPVYLLEALSRRLGRPLTAAEAGLTMAPPAPPHASWEADPVRTLSALTRSELDPRRRKTVTEGAYSLADLHLPDWPQASQASRHTATDSRASGRQVGHAEVLAAHSVAEFFGRTVQLFGGAHARATLACYLATEVTTWLQAPSSERIHRQLLSEAAQLTVLLGNMCSDAAADSLAQQYHRTGARLAADGQDAATYSIALRVMSSHAQVLGHQSNAFRLAEQAAGAARRSPGSVRSYAFAQLAVTEAQLHRHRRQSLTYLNLAERLHTEKDDSPPGPFSNYPLAGLHYQRAGTLMALGDRTSAIRSLHLSIASRGHSHSRAGALTHACLAEVQLRQGHLEAALSHWRLFVDDYPTLHSSRAAHHLQTMHQLLRPHHRRRDVQAHLAHAHTLLAAT